MYDFLKVYSTWNPLYFLINSLLFFIGSKNFLVIISSNSASLPIYIFDEKSTSLYVKPLNSNHFIHNLTLILYSFLNILKVSSNQIVSLLIYYLIIIFIF